MRRLTIKNSLKTIILLFLSLILFRGPVFRTSIKYKQAGIRQGFEITNQQLLDAIHKHSKNKTLDQDGIISIATSLTIETLSFSTEPTSSDPNEIFNTNKANCVGYAALFNSIANHLIRQNELSGLLKARHEIGQLELLGLDLHQFSNNPFFQNHDYNRIVNLVSGEVILVDPSLSDYFGINTVL